MWRTAAPTPVLNISLRDSKPGGCLEHCKHHNHYISPLQHENIVTMTRTIEPCFGSGRTVGGFFLNNQLTDFAFLPADSEGRAAANAVAGGKGPRSSMSPTILLDRPGNVVAALGSPGGNAIIAQADGLSPGYAIGTATLNVPFSKHAETQDSGVQESGGAGGIRTLDRLPYTRFPSVRDRPLCHGSANTA